ncbi:MAG TPA: PQQ-dependent sugar dehydrogenase [Syntrophorhabdaceae bacterium]|jgi:glucose/arabinose dehydrogenase
MATDAAAIFQRWRFSDMAHYGIKKIASPNPHSNSGTRLILYLCAHLLTALFIPFAASTAVAEVRLDKIKLPPGFAIDTYATNVEGARSLALGPEGIVFAGSRSSGKVYALLDRNKDHKAEEIVIIAKGLNSPNGVAYFGGSLYVAEISRILRFDDIIKQLSHLPKPVVVNDTFPKETHHGWKFIGFGPDGKLYVPVGAPCNICMSHDPRYASIMRMNPDGTDLEVFAQGVRNTVGFDWHPRTKEFWFTDNGRDWLGNNQPPDELNCAPQKGMHFGFPFCHGSNIPDPEYGGKRSCTEFVPPRKNLGPHVAALGMRFYTGAMFPPQSQQYIHCRTRLLEQDTAHRIQDYPRYGKRRSHNRL